MEKKQRFIGICCCLLLVAFAAVARWRGVTSQTISTNIFIVGHHAGRSQASSAQELAYKNRISSAPSLDKVDNDRKSVKIFLPRAGPLLLTQNRTVNIQSQDVTSQPTTLAASTEVAKEIATETADQPTPAAAGDKQRPQNPPTAKFETTKFLKPEATSVAVTEPPVEEGCSVVKVSKEWKDATLSWAWPMPASTNLNCALKDTFTCCQKDAKGKRNTLLLLLWTHVQGKAIMPPNRSLSKFKCCDGVTWSFTEDKRLMADADIIEFHLNSADIEKMEYPDILPHQLISVLTWEANPLNSHMVELFDKGVNILRSYSLLSDLPQRYEKSGGCLYAQAKRRLAVSFDNKSPTPVSALVSNCHTHSGREYIMAGLMENLPVHSYGSCMHNKILTTTDLYEQEAILSMYKFMFSVENRLCRHYITEKWSRNFRLGTVPIVASLDGEFPKYSDRMPAKGSYVNVLDFSSVTELAHHIAMVANNPMMYMEYHSYRGNGTILPKFKELYGPKTAEDPGDYCSLGRKLLNEEDFAALKRKRVKVSDIADCNGVYKILKRLPF